MMMDSKYRNLVGKISASDLAESIINEAILAGATYTHFQPGNVEVAIKYRTDGQLQSGESIPKKTYAILVSRLKALANLQANNHLPQRGRFEVNLNDKSYMIAVNTLPTIDGEKITLELSPNSHKQPSLKELGYWSYTLKSVEEAVSQKKGLIILAGPPNSGKSTSILSVLNYLNEKGLNTISIEDPIKYKANGISQIEVNPKLDLTFIKIMKTLAKQDLDVIAVSQLSNRNTFSAAVNLATGRQVLLAKYFSNDSVAIISQVTQLGIEPAIIAQSLKLVSGQRLVKRLCTSCRKSYEPDKARLSKINDIFDISRPSNMRYLHQLEIMFAGEMGDSDKAPKTTQLGSTENRIKKLWRAKANGCDECNHTGYSGRIGLYEAIVISPSIEKLILGRASNQLIRNQAVKEGTISLVVDGLVKAMQGITSVEEIIKAV